MTILLIAIGAFAATFLGGLLALKVKDKLHLILGFSAGAVIGVAFFDLMPEAIELAEGHYEVGTILSVVVVGFVLYMIIDRLLGVHGHGDKEDADDCKNDEHQEIMHKRRGIFGAGSLSVHSFLDGLAVGLAFQISTAVGLVVAIGVLAHDFSDGINTVGLIVRGGGDRKLALKWLTLDAVAPVLGIIATFFFSLEAGLLSIVLALFCGFFLYIGASDLLPESHHSHPTIWTTCMTVLGIVVLYGAVKLAGI